MSTFLYRVGKAGYSHPFKVLFAWLGILLVLGTTLAFNPPTLSSEIRIDGTPAQQLVDDLQVAPPEAAGGQGSLVFQATEGTNLNAPEQAQALAKAVEDVYATDEVVDPRALMAEAAKAAEAEAAKVTATVEAAAQRSISRDAVCVPDARRHRRASSAGPDTGWTW